MHCRFAGLGLFGVDSPCKHRATLLSKSPSPDMMEPFPSAPVRQAGAARTVARLSNACRKGTEAGRIPTLSDPPETSSGTNLHAKHQYASPLACQATLCCPRVGYLLFFLRAQQPVLHKRRRPPVRTRICLPGLHANTPYAVLQRNLPIKY